MYISQTSSEAGDKLLSAERESKQDTPEVYGEGTGFTISLSIPRIIFKSFVTDPNASSLQQISLATKKREFYLTEDWRASIVSDRYPGLSGTIVVPEKTQGVRFVFDGASIPVPWLISLLTIGVLRPLGMLLVASILHDYAFRYGYLTKETSQGHRTQFPVRRDVADALFRDIISTVNGNRFVGFVAWYFVRLGYWLRVPFNGETGHKPVVVGLSFLFLLIVAALLVVQFNVDTILVVLLTTYLFFYLVTLKTIDALSAGWFVFWEIVILTVGAVLLWAAATTNALPADQASANDHKPPSAGASF
ncbi:DUF1353 domain-containing protein [Congregibacter litoralis]|uniref:DUF1353 domain-containing protein n=1 Tax=Congregibacter litoralis KT71 TaxID=314285 RepID=A4ABD0_9GAMM|nr:DUF1353 domain-containing protein [Congregibacter litoralis]EAQ96684.1 hypothetical protein KT71_06664 [Congregibacter litoralis KT71]